MPQVQYDSRSVQRRELLALRARQERLETGIPIGVRTIEELNGLAARFGLLSLVE
jgi:hypothetical protein